MKTIVFGLVCLMTISGTAFAGGAGARRTGASEPAAATEKPCARCSRGHRKQKDTFHLTALQMSAMYVSQTGGNTWTGMFAWAPQYNFTDAFAVRANLGVSLFKNSAATHFAVFDYELMLNYTLMSDWEIEAGGGMQTWVDNTTQPVISGNFGYRPDDKILDVVDFVFIGYTRFFQTNLGANEIRLGLGIGL